MDKKILVIDNSPMYREILRDALSAEGYGVIAAAHGLEALDRLHEEHPDLVITDLIMPWIDGERLCRYIKQEPTLRATPVILISGVASELSASLNSLGLEAAVAKGPLAEFVPKVVTLARGLLPVNGQGRPEPPPAQDRGLQPRQIVQDLLEHRRHLKALLDALGVGVVETDPNGRVSYVNTAGLALLEATEEQALGRRAWEIFGSDAAGPVREALARALADTGWSPGPILIDRGRRSFEISLGRPPAEGGDGGLSLAFKEVTGTVQRERQLQALYTIAGAANEGPDLDTVLERALDAALTSLNAPRGLIRLLDPQTGELVLRTQRGFGPGYAAAHARVRIGDKAAGRVAATGEPLIIPDIRGLPEYGHLRSERDIIGLAVIPLKAGGRLLGSLSIATDGRRELAPEDLDLLLAIGRQLGMTLENARLFGERERAYQELRAAIDQVVVSERLKALGEMAAGVAHDFNNLLAAVLGRAELLLGRALPDDLRQGLEVIHRAALDGARAVRRLQDFSSKRPARLDDPHEVAQFVREVLAFLEPRLHDEVGRQGATIDVALDLQGGVVRGDAAELRDALLNIINNALDAMPTGGRLAIRSRVAAGEVEIIVADTGCGMSADTVAHIFDPFFTTKAGRGMGLGMSVTHGVIRRHGGRIRIESQPGQGTTVTVVLAAAPADAPPAPQAPSPPAPATGPRGHLLVVDDEGSLRDALAEALRLDGHAVVTAESGRAALEVFAGQPFDLVLTDLGMPDMSGIELARELKATRPHLPVGLMSGWDVTVESIRGQGAEVDFVIRKPFALATIREQVRACVA
jgi:signal transduction histidine kinase/DNA-binding response OmpR family regulator